MTRYQTSVRMPATRPWRRTTTILAAAGSLALAGCSPSDVLSIEDPDILNPGNVASAAGANAVRAGALARLNAATTGDESLFILGGMLADEWINGDSFIARQEIDRRVVTVENNFLTAANRVLHRARLSAEQAIGLLQQHSPNAPAWQIAEMHWVQAYVVNIMAEHYCSGLIFSTAVDGVPEYGAPMTSQAAYERALGHADAGLAALPAGASDASTERVRHTLQVTRGRILMNLNRPAEAAPAVAGVPNGFSYVMYHGAASNVSSNVYWTFNTNLPRYSVPDNEGGTGMNFASAADPRVPVCVGGTAGCVARATRDDQTTPAIYQQLWPQRDSPAAILNGIDARMIEAEAALRAGNPGGALTILNAARTTVPGLPPLELAVGEAAQVDQLFRERAFWQFGRGFRVGDMRRLIRQYNRPTEAVFPTGEWHKGGLYGPDVNFPIPQAEQNNPNAAGAACIDRSA